MEKAFLNTATLGEVYAGYLLSFPCPVSPCTLPLASARQRPVASDYRARHSLPGFARSSVDGYALRAADSFGASDSNPIYLELRGTIAMGCPPGPALTKGGVVDIPTGGALPEGADAVVMVEYTDKLGDSIEVRRAVAPGEHVIGPEDDVRVDEVVLPAGHLLRSADLGLLAGLGTTAVSVYPPLTVAILATGDEVLPCHTASLAPGQVRNVNSPLIAAMIAAVGHRTVDCGIAADSPRALTEALQTALDKADLVLLSGGSSAGARDFACEVINQLPQGAVDHHGLRLAPGKPTILGRAAGKPVLGLPGHPVSCAVVVDRVVLPLLRRLGGETPWQRGPVKRVTLTERVNSKAGREEYVPVRLDSPYRATPVRGPSGAIATLVRADGMIRIPLADEGHPADSEVDFYLVGS